MDLSLCLARRNGGFDLEPPSLSRQNFVGKVLTVFPKEVIRIRFILSNSRVDR